MGLLQRLFVLEAFFFCPFEKETINEMYTLGKVTLSSMHFNWNELQDQYCNVQIL